LSATASAIGLGTMEDAVKPEVVKPGPQVEEEHEQQDVTRPTKLIRIASMTRAMLDEARQAPLDEGGRERMATVHAVSVQELRDVLSPELQEEFNEIAFDLLDLDVHTSSNQ